MEPSFCCRPVGWDPDAFDGRSFCRARHSSGSFLSAEHASGLICQPCSAAVDDASDANPDEQKYRFEATKGRWGDRPEHQFTKPTGQKRDVVAKGMKRFEIGKVAPVQPAWEQLSPNVICVLGFNPSAFTLNGTCCYLVGTGKKRLLIDTAETDYGQEQFIEALDSCMQANGIEGLQEILITHWHHDHYGGIPGLLERYGRDIPIGKIPNPTNYFWLVNMVRDRGLAPYLEHEDGTPRYVVPPGTLPKDFVIPPACVLEWPDEEAEAGEQLSWDPVRRTKAELIRDYGFIKRSYKFHENLEHKWNFHEISHGDIIRTEGASLVAYHTPGHAYDHCSFWLQEEKSLFSGDHVLGWGTTFMADLYEYMVTLQFMIALKPVHLYPGHGPMIDDGLGLLERYIVHRKEREDQVEDVLLQSSDAISVSGIVDKIYTETPQNRKWMARENVGKILRKFDKAGIAIPFMKREDGTVDRFDFPQGMFLRDLPPGLVWVHRFHFRVGAGRVEARERPKGKL